MKEIKYDLTPIEAINLCIKGKKIKINDPDLIDKHLIFRNNKFIFCNDDNNQDITKYSHFRNCTIEIKSHLSSSDFTNTYKFGIYYD